jgi:hypothetical protein
MFWSLAAFAQAAAIQRTELHPYNLITHSEVLIARPAADIWPYILDPSGWKMVVASDLIAGEPDQLGEVRRISGGSGDQAYTFTIETVALQVNSHKVVKIYPDDGTHFGFSAWRLFEQPGGTLVTYDVYSENRIPGLSTEQARAQQQHDYELNQPRLDQELLKLKELLANQ